MSDLRRHLAGIGVEASPIENAASQGSRGDISIAGQLALGIISSGSLVALIGCLRAYIEREKKLTIEIENTVGQRVKVHAENVNGVEFQSLLHAITGPVPER